MNWDQIKTQATWAALTSVFAFAVGLLFGTSDSAKLSAKMDRLTDKFEHWEKTAEGRRVFMTDAGSRLEMLCAKDKDCSKRFQPMKVPE